MRPLVTSAPALLDEKCRDEIAAVRYSGSTSCTSISVSLCSCLIQTALDQYFFRVAQVTKLSHGWLQMTLGINHLFDVLLCAVSDKTRQNMCNQTSIRLTRQTKRLAGSQKGIALILIILSDTPLARVDTVENAG
jgi:hypothetical protein